MRKLISVLFVLVMFVGCEVDLKNKVISKSYKGSTKNECYYYLEGADAYIVAPCDCWDVGDIPINTWGNKQVKIEAEAKDSLSK